MNVFLKAVITGFSSFTFFPSGTSPLVKIKGTDQERLASDWKALGEDMKKVIKKDAPRR